MFVWGSETVGIEVVDTWLVVLVWGSDVGVIKVIDT